MARVDGLLSLARSRAASDLLVTFGGRAVQMGLGLVGSVISARALGPSDLGRFGLVMAVVTIGGTIADAGLTYTTIKFIAQYQTQNADHAQAIAYAYWVLRLASGALTAGIGLLIAAPVATGLLGAPALLPYLQIAFATLISLGISSYPSTVMVGLAQFRRLGVAGILNSAITVAGITGLLLVGRLDLGTLIGWNVLLPVLSTLPAWGILPAAWRPWRLRKPGSPRLPTPPVLREVFGFSKWMVVSAVGSIIAAQGDVILLGRLAGPAAVGVYSVALTLALRVDTLNQSLITIMLPRLGRLKVGAVRGYGRRILAGTLILAGILGALGLLAVPLILVLYGARYGAVAGLFLALLAVVLFDLLTSTLFLTALPLNQPRVLAVADWLRVGLLGLAGWLLIPPFGGFGAAGARAISRVGGGLYTLRLLARATPAPPDE